MNSTPDPLALAETVLAPLRMLFGPESLCLPMRKPAAICVTPEQFDAIVQLPVMLRELREAVGALQSRIGCKDCGDYGICELCRKALERSGV